MLLEQKFQRRNDSADQQMRRRSACFRCPTLSKLGLAVETQRLAGSGAI
jgi:hypothetical protein